MELPLTEEQWARLQQAGELRKLLGRAEPPQTTTPSAIARSPS